MIRECSSAWCMSASCTRLNEAVTLPGRWQMGLPRLAP
jgi:hypothetical protein